MTSLIDVNRAACIEVICGSSGSGKSHFVKNRIKREKRLIIYDPDSEYSDIGNIQTVRTIAELTDLVRRHLKSPLRVRFVPPPSDKFADREAFFGKWAQTAFAWCNCVAVAEELAGVTKPSRAVGGWHTLVSRGRKRGIAIYAVMQRPAESDKTVIGNATALQVGKMTRHADRAYMAAEMDISPQDILRLGQFEYIRKDIKTGKCVIGKVGRSKNKPLTTMSA